MYMGDCDGQRLCRFSISRGFDCTDCEAVHALQEVRQEMEKIKGSHSECISIIDNKIAKYESKLFR